MKRNKHKISLWKRKPYCPMSPSEMAHMIWNNTQFRPKGMTVQEREMITEHRRKAEAPAIQLERSTHTAPPYRSIIGRIFG
jgi:hypothetical protein